eukprot:4179446-Pyramimonas_sp.AAC.1
MHSSLATPILKLAAVHAPRTPGLARRACTQLYTGSSVQRLSCLEAQALKRSTCRAQICPCQYVACWLSVLTLVLANVS